MSRCWTSQDFAGRLANMSELTPLGALLEQARAQVGISKREAARRAGVSEGRWRQVTTGVQKLGSTTVPVNPRLATVLTMARAVGVDELEAAAAAGFEEVTLGDSAASLRSVQVSGPASERVEALIRDIYASQMPERRKGELVRLIRQAEAVRLAELQAAEDELRRWRDRPAG